MTVQPIGLVGAPNYRFSEYVTSGAFSLSLTRNQVSALATIAAGGNRYHSGAHTAALERKGLIEAIARPEDWNPDSHEYRATHAGLLCAAMLADAGLVAEGKRAVASELANLKREVEERRLEAFAAHRLARSALAKLDKLELEVSQTDARKGGDRMPMAIVRRDPMPDKSAADLAAMIPEPGQ